MPEAVPWIVLSIVGAAVVLIVVFAVRYEGERHQVFLQSWRDYATSRGLAWSPAVGPWYRRCSDAVEGTVEGVPVRLDTYVVSTGKTHVTFTRATSHFERDAPSKVTVSRRHFLTGLGETLGMKTVKTGDASFDERMVVRAKDAAMVRGTIDETVRARTLAMPSTVTLRVDGRTAKVTWRGKEKEPRTLDAALALAASVSRACART